MEVYKITNLANGKVYIGSTKYTKEARWSYGSSSHVGIAIRQAREGELYRDIRNLGVENFKVETLIDLGDSGSEPYLRRLESATILNYKLRGVEELYNRTTITCSYKSQSSKATRAKSNATNRLNHGGLIYFHTSEARLKAQKTKRINAGVQITQVPISNKYEEGSKEFNSYESRRVGHCSIFEYKGELYYGGKEVYNKLVTEGYDLSLSVVKKWCYGYIAKYNRERYPELVDAIKVVKKRGYNKGK